jgi:hypothetical protein
VDADQPTQALSTWIAEIATIEVASFCYDQILVVRGDITVVLINPARNPSIFRKRVPIRLWYPSRHLLRHNPLPRSPVRTEKSDSGVLVMKPTNQGMRHDATDPLNRA